MQDLQLILNVLLKECIFLSPVIFVMVWALFQLAKSEKLSRI